MASDCRFAPAISCSDCVRARRLYLVLTSDSRSGRPKSTTALLAPLAIWKRHASAGTPNTSTLGSGPTAGLLAPDPVTWRRSQGGVLVGFSSMLPPSRTLLSRQARDLLYLSDLDRSDPRPWNSSSDADRLVEILGIDQEVSGKLLARLHERTVGHEWFTVAHPHGNRRGDRLQRRRAPWRGVDA